MKRNILSSRAAFIVLFMISIWFSVAPGPAAAERPTVYATIYPIYDFTDNIGGERIDLHLLIPAGAEPHTWEPSARLMGRTANADLLVYVGAGMEPWIDRLLEAVAGPDLRTLKITSGLDLLHFSFEEASGHLTDESHHKEDKSHNPKEADHGHHHGEYDPHVWLDPLRAVEISAAIRDALIAIDGQGADYYHHRYDEYKKRLKALHKKYATALADIPRREIIVNHAAFGYLADRYNLIQIPIKGLTHEEEPSAARLAEITRIIQNKNIHYIFYETLTSRRLSEVVAQEADLELLPLHPLDGLTTGEKEADEDYISIMEKNLDVLTRALED